MRTTSARYPLAFVAVAVAFVNAAGCAMGTEIEEEPPDDSAVEQGEATDENMSVERVTDGEELVGQTQEPLLKEICGVKDSLQGIPDDQSTEFEVGQGSGQLESGEKVSLFDTVNKRFVQYGKRSSGINLTWNEKERAGSIELHKEGGGVIRYGDKVAIRVDKGGFLKYGKRRWGINLNWVGSDTKEKPYEWEVRGGPTGSPVEKNKPVRLFNTVENDNLIYCRRPVGINLGWAKDCTSIPTQGRFRTGYCP